MSTRKIIVGLSILLSMASCTSYKHVPYMQNPEVVNSYRDTLPLYDAKIMPKDLLWQKI